MLVVPIPPCAEQDAELHRWLALTPEAPLEPELEIVDPVSCAAAHIFFAHSRATMQARPLQPTTPQATTPTPAGLLQSECMSLSV
jgi:hypothetical protein